ncbi:hypothetical protein DPMN_080524 [Dreissena polymorpha]|uniref:C2H2-type domain-containing protein n=2 Tax=Dreissena polymorpha TaxID=45954 RepID=A0A9D4BRZ2_DREPO|nr:hypothetical protein DPMN_080524 [Dreissena polymorpha]
MRDHQKNCKVYLFEHGVNRCEKCKKIFKDAEALEQHETKCSTTCPICNKELASKDTFKRHLATHDPNGAKFMCPHCGKRHYHKWELKDHLRSKHLPLAQCNDCGEMVPGGAHPKRCKAKVQQNICPYCAITIRGTGYHLKRHIQKAHLEDDDDKKMNGVPKYECSRCQQKFVLKWHAKRHVQACDAEPPAEALVPGPDDTIEADQEEKQQLREPRDDVSQQIVLDYQIQN